MKKTLLLLSILALIPLLVNGQDQESDSTKTNQDAIYNRPFISLGQSQTAVGGYLEGNTNYFSEDGVSEGFSMELRRFNIFLYSQIGKNIRFLSELEFEHGTEEIALETALLDFELNTALNFRAGIILPAIGLFNTNHDSPNWEFVERPISSTEIIPTTLSEVGVGIFGKFYPNEHVILSYDAYIVNGLQDNIILNEQGRTHLASGKSEEMFAEDNNGTPMLNGRLGFTHRQIGEFGLAYYGGVYNTFKVEGEPVDEKRSVRVVAFDFSSSVKKLEIKGEAVLATIEVPQPVSEIYGDRQYGVFVDLIYPAATFDFMNFEDVVLNVAGRFEYADFNANNFVTNINTPIGDENVGLAFGLSLRPTSGTVIRANYRHHWIKDRLGNPQAKAAGFQFGIASYF